MRGGQLKIERRRCCNIDGDGGRAGRREIAGEWRRWPNGDGGRARRRVEGPASHIFTGGTLPAIVSMAYELVRRS